jgi:hypothetical protein
MGKKAKEEQKYLYFILRSKMIQKNFRILLNNHIIKKIDEQNNNILEFKYILLKNYRRIN